MKIKNIIILCASLLLMGCEDLNTFCPTDSNETNSSDCNTTCPDCNTTCPDDNNDSNDTDSNITAIGLNTIASSSQGYNPTNSTSCSGTDSCADSSSCSDSDSCSSSCSDSSSDSNPTADSDSDSDKNFVYYLHTDIKTTLFWIGEANKNASAWNNDWMMHYGGVDTPDQRTEYYPQAFTPEENPFYAALPYNDLDNNGELKPNIQTYIPWATDNDNPGLSICKNRWIEISAHRKSAYAQWEDVGPLGDNDINYVFGSSEPFGGDISALTVSPAVRDYLGLDENDTVAWKFVDFAQVPSGPWRDIVTTSISD